LLTKNHLFVIIQDKREQGLALNVAAANSVVAARLRKAQKDQEKSVDKEAHSTLADVPEAPTSDIEKSQGSPTNLSGPKPREAECQGSKSPESRRETF